MTEPLRRPPLRLIAGGAAEGPVPRGSQEPADARLGDHRAAAAAGVLAEPVPRVPADAFSRDRLLGRLDAVWDLALVHGPGGSGKSTLVAQWARRQRVPIHWFDAERLAAQRAASPDRAILAELLRSAAGGVVVIDAADSLDPACIVELGAALDHAPETRLVVTTRSGRVAEELGAATDAAILVIDAAELRVRDEELAAVAPGLSASRRVELLADSGELVLAVRAFLSEHRERLRARSLTRLRETAASRPDGYLDALARLGLVREVDARLAECIDVDPQWLPLVEEDGLGQLVDGWLTVSAFAAEVLAPLTAAIAVEERTRLLRAALDGDFLDDRPVESLRIAFELRDFDRATDVIVYHGWFFFGDARGVRRAFAGVDAASLDRHPLLLALLAQLSMMEASTRGRGLRLFGQTILALGLRAKQVNPRDGAMFRAIAATLLRFTPIADQALGRVRKSQAELLRLGLDHELRLGRSGAQLLTHFGLTSFAAGEERVADEELAESYGQLHEMGRAEMVDPLTLRSAFLAFRGELPLARELATRADEIEWPLGWVRGATAQGINLARAILVLETGDYAAATAHLEAGGPIGDLLEHWPLFAAVQAWRDALAGEVLAGRARMAEVRRRRGRGAATSVQYARMDAADSLLALMAGDLAEARRLARAASAVPQGRIALARAQLALGREADASASLQRLDGVDLTVRDQVEADLLRAVLALRAGAPRDAELVLGRAAADVDRTGLLVPLVALSDADRAQLIGLAKAAGLAGLVDALERARPGRPVDDLRVPALSKRELLVLDRLADAQSTAELAEMLYVSVNTVKSQLRSIYRKLGVTTREQAIARYLSLGLGNRDR